MKGVLKMSNLKGIDVSVWQGNNIDFEKVKNDGIDFVIIRAGYGKETSQVDKYFELNYKKAKSAGLKVGAYWYSYASTIDAGKAEADACIKVIKGKQFEMPIYFDIEERDILNKGEAWISAMTEKFCSTMEKAGYYVGIYTSTGYLNKFSKTVLKKYTLWLAQWASRCTYSGEKGMWQFSNNGSVKGINGRVDLDVCYIDFESAIKKNKLNGYSGTTAKTVDNVHKSVDNPNKKVLKSVTSEIVEQVVRGDWGNGTDRTKKLANAGYDPEEVQKAVNTYVTKKSAKKKVTQTLVKEVVRGKYGNGTNRKTNLENAGYDYIEVQNAVNDYFKKGGK